MGGKVVPGLDRSAQQHNNKRLDTQEDTMAGNWKRHTGLQAMQHQK